MNKIYEEILKENFYTHKFENGLNFIFIPRKNTSKKYVIWGVKYGSIDHNFVPKGEKGLLEVPDGVAHFLEHKLFEQKTGKNSLDTLSELGTNPNAYTTNDYTAYLYECNDNFYPAFDEFMNYVQNPYFTDENVEKEKGIINQEIKMYDDHPMWNVYLNFLDCLYINNPVKRDVAGTVESVSKINKKILYSCYNTFYTPSNMILAIAGDFDEKEIKEEVEKRLEMFESDEKINKEITIEPKKVNKKNKTETMDIENPMFIIGFKDNEIFDKNKIVKKDIALEILLNMLLGETSDLYEKLYEEQMILGDLGFSYEFSPTFAHVVIEGVSKNPEKVLEVLNLEIEKFRNSGFNIEKFNKSKKMLYGNLVKQYNDINYIARNFVDNFVKDVNPLDYLKEFSKVEIRDLEKVLNEVLLEENQVISIVKGK